MLGGRKPESVRRNVEKALIASDLEYSVMENGAFLIKAMGDDLPIAMTIAVDPQCFTLNIYCHLLFEVPEDSVEKLSSEINGLNNAVNNGSFFMALGPPRICFKVIQSYYGKVPSVRLIQHLMGISFATVDVNDGKLKELVRKYSLKRDVMYGRAGALIISFVGVIGWRCQQERRSHPPNSHAATGREPCSRLG